VLPEYLSSHAETSLLSSVDLTPSSRCLSKRLKDYNEEGVSPKEMVAELSSDN